MEKSNKRGKIPQTDWPLIMARYDAGETLASIARTYDCSPPAISYIVSRNRDKPANETPPPAPLEPQLIKAHSNGSSANAAVATVGATAAPVAASMAVTEAVALAEAPVHRNGAGTPPAAPGPVQSSSVQNGPARNGSGEPRAKLHLGFGSGNGSGNGHNNGHGNGNGMTQPQQQRPFQAPRANPFDDGQNNRDFAAPREPRPLGQAPQMPHEDAAARKEGSAALDLELRTRIDGDLTAFLAAFDAVLAADTQESRFGLKEATDRLLRVGARTRIELERLEAKVPLSPRDGGRAEPAWRYR